MAGTVVLDDVELREAQRDYLDFLDDEVRKARGRASLLLGVPGDADGPRLATTPRGAAAGSWSSREDRWASGLLRPDRRPQNSSMPDLVTFLAVESVISWSPVGASLTERSCNLLISANDSGASRKCTQNSKAPFDLLEITPCSSNLEGVWGKEGSRTVTTLTLSMRRF